MGFSWLGSIYSPNTFPRIARFTLFTNITIYYKGWMFQNWVGTSYLAEIDARKKGKGCTNFGCLEPPKQAPIFWIVGFPFNPDQGTPLWKGERYGVNKVKSRKIIQYCCLDEAGLELDGREGPTVVCQPRRCQQGSCPIATNKTNNPKRNRNQKTLTRQRGETRKKQPESESPGRERALEWQTTK